MPAVQCPSCESDDIDAVGKSAAGDLQLRCELCGTEWTRTPNRPCPQCSAIDVTHTDAAGYLCRGCGHSWRDIPVTATPVAPAKATRARAARAGTTPRAFAGGLAHRLESVWKTLEAHAGEPFTLKSGQEFTYQVSGAVLMPTSANWDVPKSEFGEALRRMPVSGPAQLKDLQAAAFIYALLHDDRIAPAMS
jgi:transposase-like protein